MVEWVNYVPLKDDIEDTLLFFGIELPVELEKIIKQYNKGVPSMRKIPIGNGKYASFYRLLSFNRNDNYSIFSIFDDELKSLEIFPFATTENGSYICLKDQKVILYNIEKNTEKNIANSFTDFLNMLY